MTEISAPEPAGKTLPVIDFHAHVLTPAIYERAVNHNVVTDFGRHPLQAPDDSSPRWRTFSRMTDAALQAGEMRPRGVDISVISSSTVAQGSWWAAPREAAELDRVVNEQIADWVRRYPDRYIGAFTLPMQDMKLALRELDYAVSALGLKVVNASSSDGETYIGDEKFWPFWEAVEALGLPVWLHPHGVTDPRYQKFALWNGVGQPVEETMAMASIIYEGVFERFPKVKIVMAHGGGYLPHYAGRLDRNLTAYPTSGRNLTRKPSEYLRSFYYDSCVYEAATLAALIQRVGIDRIVLGSDYPVGESDPIGFVRQCKGLSEADIAMIVSRTPAAVLGRIAAA